MPLFLVSILILVVALFFPLLLFFTGTKSDPKLPPGNLGFIGESLAFFYDKRRGVPEKFFYDRMQKFSSEIFKTSLFGETAFVFCQAAGNKFLFTNEQKLVKTCLPKGIAKLFPPSPPSNGAVFMFRRMIVSFVNPESLQKRVSTMDSLCKQHIKNSCENKREVSIVPLARLYTFAVACKIFLNVEDPIHIAKLDHLFSCVASGLWALPINLPGTSHNKVINASKLIKKDLVEIIKRRKIELATNKASPDQDVLSSMLTTTDDEGRLVILEDLDIASKLLGVIIAGYETSGYCISLTIMYISDFTYTGYSIPKGAKLYWNTSSTHKNPDYFPDP